VVTIKEIQRKEIEGHEVLPEGIEVVMMPESEFKSLLEGEGMEELEQQFKRRKEKLRQERQPTVAKITKKSNRVDITGNCESTSSKVKVEDLITDEDEVKEVPRQQRKLWDRPVPPPDHQWVRDPRLPVELNEMNACRYGSTIGHSSH
jgi:DNA-binding protein YbaB